MRFRVDSKTITETATQRVARLQMVEAPTEARPDPSIIGPGAMMDVSTVSLFLRDDEVELFKAGQFVDLTLTVIE